MRGGRFKTKLNKKALRFHASIDFDQKLYQYDIEGSQAHARMLAKQGIIQANEASLLCQGLESIKKDIAANRVEFELELEDIHMNIESLLQKRIGEVAQKLHTGRSRNDQVALDLRLYLRDKADAILAHLTTLMQCISSIASFHDKTIMPGYTHLQRAQPISLANHLEAYCAMLKRDKARLEDCRERMNFSPLGAGALCGSGLPLDREFVALELRFTGIIENTLDAVSDRDFVIEFCAFASILMMHLSRLCEDIILWATEEFAFITLSDDFATGSSLMPNKRNPDLPELIRGKSGRVFGHLIAQLTMMKGLPLSYNKDMQEDKEALFDTVDTLLSCLEVLPDFLKSLTFHQEVMQSAVNNSLMNATQLVEELVKEGYPFRLAHEKVGKWVAQALLEKTSLNEVKSKAS